MIGKLVPTKPWSALALSAMHDVPPSLVQPGPYLVEYEPGMYSGATSFYLNEIYTQMLLLAREIKTTFPDKSPPSEAALREFLGPRCREEILEPMVRGALDYYRGEKPPSHDRLLRDPARIFLTLVTRAREGGLPSREVLSTLEKAMSYAELASDDPTVQQVYNEVLAQLEALRRPKTPGLPETTEVERPFGLPPGTESNPKNVHIAGDPAPFTTGEKTGFVSDTRFLPGEVIVLNNQPTLFRITKVTPITRNTPQEELWAYAKLTGRAASTLRPGQYIIEVSPIGQASYIVTDSPPVLTSLHAGPPQLADTYNKAKQFILGAESRPSEIRDAITQLQLILESLRHGSPSVGYIGDAALKELDKLIDTGLLRLEYLYGTTLRITGDPKLIRVEPPTANFKQRLEQSVSPTQAVLAVSAGPLWKAKELKATLDYASTLGKTWIPADLSVPLSESHVARIVYQLNKAGSTELYITGPSIHELSVYKSMNQHRVNGYMYRILEEITRHPDLKQPIRKIYTSGQNGVGLAAALAGSTLGIEVIVVPPRDYTLIERDGSWNPSKKAFMDRFTPKTTGEDTPPPWEPSRVPGSTLQPPLRSDLIRQAVSVPPEARKHLSVSYLYGLLAEPWLDASLSVRKYDAYNADYHGDLAYMLDHGHKRALLTNRPIAGVIRPAGCTHDYVVTGLRTIYRSDLDNPAFVNDLARLLGVNPAVLLTYPLVGNVIVFLSRVP